MSEVTEGELVMWSVDPGPMAGVLERKLWRMATAARSYLNRMRAAELAHGVMAGERDTVTVERDEAYKQRDAAVHLGNVLASERDMARLAEVEAQLGGRAASREIAELQVELAARRVWEKAEGSIAGGVREVLGTAAGQNIVHCAADVMAELRRLREARDGQVRAAQQAAEAARATMRRMEIDHAAALAVARMDAAEAEPPQVFRPPISVTVHHVTGHAFAEVEVGDITDPAFLALPMGARLGLVVCDE